MPDSHTDCARFVTMARRAMTIKINAAEFSLNRLILPNMTEEQEQRYRLYKLAHRKLKRVASCISTYDEMVYNIARAKYEEVTFNVLQVTAITKPIILNYVTLNNIHLAVPMGRYRVEFDFGINSISINSFVNNIVCGPHIHPHIMGNVPCWGSYVNMRSALMRNYDIAGILTLVQDYLSTCDREGWYTSVLHFAEKVPALRGLVAGMCKECELVECTCGVDRCDDCGERIEDCTCINRCDNCHMLEGDCICILCPLDGERLERDTFPDISCLRCGHCIRDDDTGYWRCVGTLEAPMNIALTRMNPHFTARIDAFDERDFAINDVQYLVVRDNAWQANRRR